MPSHCQHNNDSSLELPALMSDKPNLTQAPTKERAELMQDETTLFQVCCMGNQCDLCCRVNMFTPSDLSAASSLSSCFIWKDQGWLVCIARRAGFGLGFGL